MSVFKTANVTCPSCEKSLPFKVVESVNADRRPDLRDAIVEGSFQREACPHCGEGFRLEPEMNYLDAGRRQWVAAFPLASLGEWNKAEEQAREAFAKAFGDKAPEAARDLGRDLEVRVTFGWSALREKLVVRDNNLDDVTLELLKVSLIRGMDNPPLSDDTELRLVEVEGTELVIAWIRAADESVVEMLRVPRRLYFEIDSDLADWLPLRESISAGPFVDAQRLMVESG